MRDKGPSTSPAKLMFRRLLFYPSAFVYAYGMTFLSHSFEDTAKLARAVRAWLVAKPDLRGTADIIALQGNLGAGKTHFVKALARAFELPDLVTSPTFVIQKIYYMEGQVYQNLIHIDAYRLESDAELHAIGWHEAATDPHNLICIEWPERVGLAVPERALWLSFEVTGETDRTITAHGPGSEGLEKFLHASK